jgi:translation initiation factor IF-2
MRDLRADRGGLVEAVVVESQAVKGLGAVATLLVRRGTLRPGTVLVAGFSWGKVRAITATTGAAAKQALPSDAVQVSGWSSNPHVGDLVLEASSEVRYYFF